MEGHRRSEKGMAGRGGMRMLHLEQALARIFGEWLFGICGRGGRRELGRGGVLVRLHRAPGLPSFRRGRVGQRTALAQRLRAGVAVQSLVSRLPPRSQSSSQPTLRRKAPLPI